MRRPLRILTRLRRDEDGAMVIVIALMMTALMALLGVGVEIGTWYMARRTLQTAADAAAIAGALEYARGNPGAITSAAEKEAVRNGVRTADGDGVRVFSPPTSGALAGRADAVEAVVTRQQPALFSAVLHSGAVTITTRAVAMVNDAGRACVLALDGNRGSAVRAQGSPSVQMAGCMIAANSNAANAIDFGGNASVTAQSLWAVGGVSTGGSAAVSLAVPATTYAWPLLDPYAGVQVGAVPACSSIDLKKVTVIPGNTTLCDPDFQNGTYTMGPGPVYIDGGNMKLTGKTNIVLTDGTLVLTSKHSGKPVAGIDISGGSSLTITAPSDPGSPFRGIAILQDRAAATGNVNKFNATDALNMSGAVYFPSQEVQWSGNNALAGPGCVQIVALAVTFTGNAALANDNCSTVGAAPLATTAARLGE